MRPAGVEAFEVDAGRGLRLSNLGTGYPGSRTGGEQSAAKIAP
jgi:hypothetical protein